MGIIRELSQIVAGLGGSMKCFEDVSTLFYFYFECAEGICG